MLNNTTRDGRLRPMITSDLENILKLRNHPKIRQYMLSQHEISIEEHSSWFKSVSNDRNVMLYVFDLDELCIGFVQFKRTNHCGVVDWGFYVAPDAPRGTGKKLGNAALHQAFEIEGFRKVCGQALKCNKPSHQFHKSLGFVQEGILRYDHLRGGKYQELVCFGLLSNKWKEKL